MKIPVTQAKIQLSFLIILYFTGSSYGQNFQSSNLPVIVIDTRGKEIQNEPKIPATMGVIYNGSGIRNNVTDAYNEYDGPIGIEYRGSSSQFLFPKKSFAVETRDESGENNNVELLGFPAENDWVFYGPYSDKSLLRNVLTFKLGRDLGRYASRALPLEFILNDEYQGLYVLMEKVKKDSNRVDIATLNPDENSGDDLTGGYIVKLDKYDGENSGAGWASPYFPPGRSADQEVYFQFHYPKNDEITPQQAQYIQNYITNFEEALAGNDFLDPQNGYAKYIDVDSFVDFLIIMEVTRNVDGYRLSTFLYKDKDSKNGKLTLGPIWDFNLAFGNADYCQGWDYEGWAYDFNSFCSNDFWLIPFWWNRLLQDPAFRLKLKKRWTELRSGPYETSKILEFIEEQADYINEAQIRNFQKWPVLDEYVWPNAFVGGDFESEIQFLKDWVSNRLQWLDDNIGFVTTGTNEINTMSFIKVFPNPFIDRIRITLPENGKVTIFNSIGKQVFKSGGSYKDFTWEGNNNDGKSLVPGTYIIRITFDRLPDSTFRIIKL